MIKAIQLIFEPVSTWAKIGLDRKSIFQIFSFFLTPLIVLSVAAEVAGIFYLNKYRNPNGLLTIPRTRLFEYIGAEFFGSFLMVFVAALVLRSLARSFHPRHTYAQCFTLAAYAYSPLFLVRMLDAIPPINPWATFALGILLTVATVYYGVPAALQPDPPNAFGIYLMSALLIAGIAGIFRLLTLLLLAGKLKILNADALYNY
ncbi:MAG TPA: Yip1 family protein [Verrucomicrobiae bacterium]|jgi:hypothetical protein|nr:Yip1 family protein [Verrucomicrobiae bacterium]